MDLQQNSSTTDFSSVDESSHQPLLDDGESPLRGLYLDLLGCLGGANHVEPKHRKPMTGFSQILNLITDVLADQNVLLGANTSVSSTEDELTSTCTRIHELHEHCSESTLPSPQFSDRGVDGASFPSPTDSNVGLIGDMQAKVVSASLDALKENMFEDVHKISKPGDIDHGDCYNSGNGAKLPYEPTRSLALDPQITVSEPRSIGNGHGKHGEVIPKKKVYKDPTHSRSEPAVKQAAEDETEDWMDKSPFSIGGSMITKLLENLLPFTQRESAGACRFLSEIPEKANSGVLENAESSKLVTTTSATSSVYHDCCVGAALSSDDNEDNVHYSSAESEVGR